MTDDAPDAANPPSGCRFHEACPKAREVCPQETPELFSGDGSGDHLASCFRQLENHEYWNSDSLHEEGEQDIPL